MEELIKELKAQNKLLALIHAYQRGSKIGFSIKRYEEPYYINQNAKQILEEVYKDNINSDSSS